MAHKKGWMAGSAAIPDPSFPRLPVTKIYLNWTRESWAVLRILLADIPYRVRCSDKEALDYKETLVTAHKPLHEARFVLR